MLEKSVAIFGGGVAGLSAAHELIRLGYRVDVYERSATLGGKAQSQSVAGTAAGSRLDLPGEHGFRFYPSFYRYLILTMSEIPLDPDKLDGPKVADNLHPCDEAGFGAADGGGLRKMLRREPRSFFDLAATLSLFFEDLRVSPLDAGRFGKKMLRYLSSCRARRDKDFEAISWWQYVDGDSYEPKFQKYLRSVPRIMVAMDPRSGSARTIGNISMQLIVDYGKDGVNNDRTLIGPTTDKWIRPWQAFLERQGVAFHLGQGITRFDFDEEAGRITGAHVAGQSEPVKADYYLLAAPLEVAVGLVTDEMGEREGLDRLRKIRDMGLADSSGIVSLDDPKMTDWMVGIQFYLREDVPLVRGHVFFPDSPWALSVISQAQFWGLSGEGHFRDRFGSGDTGGILSVDVSAWNVPGILYNKPAKQCTREEIRAEVWAQLKAGLNGGGRTLLTDDLLCGEPNLDAGIQFPSPAAPTNATPLLVHPPDSWNLRPKAATGIPNLMLAADYVQNETILACMEGANEAARAAVKAILAEDGRPYDRPDMPLTEPSIFDGAKRLDEIVYSTIRTSADKEKRANQLASLWEDDPSKPIDLDGLRRLEAEVREHSLAEAGARRV